jgi:hypothetical protein
MPEVALDDRLGFRIIIALCVDKLIVTIIIVVNVDVIPIVSHTNVVYGF